MLSSPSPNPRPAAHSSLSVARPRGLEERLATVTADIESSAEVVRADASERTLAWVLGQPADWSFAQAGAELEAGLAPWDEVHGWRGPCARWIDALRCAWHEGAGTAGRSRAPQVGTGLAGTGLTGTGLTGTGLTGTGLTGTVQAGHGRASSARLALATVLKSLAADDALERAMRAADHAASSLAGAECILVHGASECIERALECAQERGLGIQVILAQAAPDFAGERLAHRLAHAGLSTTVVSDLAVLSRIESADRVWVGTEAIGPESFASRVGLEHIARTAREAGVPVELLATGEHLVPGGELILPRHCTGRKSTTGAGVRYELALYEAAPLALVGRVRTEAGAETPAKLHLRTLATSRAAPCRAAESTSCGGHAPAPCAAGPTPGH